MPEFTYKVRDAQGLNRTGTIEADSEAAVVARLREQKLIPILVESKKAGGNREIKIPGLDRINLKDKAISARQLATMINAGLPLLRAVSVLADQTESKPLAKIWVQVAQDIESGASFSGALLKHPKAFDDLFVSMVRAGEAGGVLDDVLIRIADTLEKQVELRGKVKSAMTYPIMVALMVLLILTAILIFVVPTFETLYADLGGILPLPTRLLLLASRIMKKFFPLVVLAMVLAVFGVKRLIRTPAGRLQYDKLKLKMPIFGPLFRKVAMSRFSRTLGVLMRSGVPVLQSLEITGHTVQNKVVALALKDVASSVREGESLAGPLQRHEVFPPMVVQMLAVGEETGAVDTMLEKVADFYDQEVAASVDSLTSLIEPLLISLLGGVVGGILISLYLPLFRIINLIE